MGVPTLRITAYLCPFWGFPFLGHSHVPTTKLEQAGHAVLEELSRIKSQASCPLPETVNPRTVSWIAVKELKSSYYNSDTILFTINPYSGNFLYLYLYPL